MTALNHSIVLDGDTVKIQRTPDSKTANRFLELIDPFGQFTFQTFDDNKQRKDAYIAKMKAKGIKNPDDPFAKIYHGSLNDRFDILCRKNAQGAGVFVTVNETDLKGRSEKNITRVRAIYCEIDRPNSDAFQLGLAASINDKLPMIVESSKGKFHLYWVIGEGVIALDEFQQLQQAFIRKMLDYGVDTQVHDLPRVMRIAGFFHCKGEPFQTRIVEEGEQFTADEIREELAPFMISDDTPINNEVTEETELYLKESFYASVNSTALANLSHWVTALFPTAVNYKAGYRVASDDLGRNLEEAIGIQPKGIKDFGEDGKGYTPIDLVMKHCTRLDTKQANTAAFWLCDQMDVDPVALGWNSKQGDALDQWKANAFDGFNDEGQPVVKPKLLSPIGELIKTPVPLEWTIQSLIEHNTLSLIFGESGGGKSFVTLSMAFCIATGTDWYGREVKQGTVIYAAGEGHSGITRRAKGWSIENNISLNDARLYVSKKSVIFNEPASFDPFIAEIDAMPEKPVLVVIDTLARSSIGLEENSAKDMSQFVDRCDEIKHRYGCTVLVVHHTGVGDQSRVRGSSAIKAALDVQIAIVKQHDLVTLKCEKMKDGTAFDDIGLKFKTVSLPADEGWIDEHGFPLTTAVLEPTAETVSKGKKIRSLPKAQRVALDALIHCMGENSRRIDVGGYDVEAVHEDDWRQRCYQTGIATTEKANSKATAFKRALDNLMEKGMVNCWEDQYYL